MIPEARRSIFHVDMDAFYASIEQRDNPDARGKPVIVGALPGNRGVVCAASYEARKFGIHSAMPISRAHALCPQGIFVVPRMDVYAGVSREVMEVFSSFSPRIEQISVDEAFIDMTGTGRIFGEAAAAAKALQNAVFERTACSCSVGVAPNKLLAKIASAMHKPRGITITPFEQEAIEAWLAPLPAGKIWGVGEKTAEALRGVGVATIGQIQELSLSFLSGRFGSYGEDLFRLCRGLDERDVALEARQAQSISREHTFPADCGDVAEMKRVLLVLSGDVGFRARAAGLAGRTITLTWRLPDFSRHSRRLTLPDPADLSADIYKIACLLFDEQKSGFSKLRLIGIGLSGFDTVARLDLFDDPLERERREASERAMDTIVNRYGDKAIFRGGEQAGSARRPARTQKPSGDS